MNFPSWSLLKIPKWWQRMTDNTMAKRTRTNNDLQNIIQKTKDRSTQTTLKTRGAFRCSRRGKQFLLHKWKPLYYSCYKPKAWLIFWSTTFTFYISQNISVTPKTFDLLHNLINISFFFNIASYLDWEHYY